MSDGSLQRMSARNKKFCEGWLEHKAHRPTGYRYERLFGLLEGNVMYIFSTDAPSQETQIGNLTIDSNTEFIKGKGHPSKGYKFDLNTGTRLNRFKTKKSTERELWRGYVIGISKGDVPNDLDLLDSEVKEIKQNVAAFHGSEVVDYDPKRSSIASGVSQRSQVSRGKDSGVVSLGGMSRQSGSSSDDSRSRRSVASTVSGTVDHGGPTVVHKFYNDHNRDQKPPSWFIPHCSREMAEKVLERAVTENYGNTLMRESTSYLSNGSYVISKINVNKRDGRVEFEHFEVIRTSQGYKVNVQNHHQPMKCLQDVMDYFVGTSGGSTRPLEVNDPTFLAQDTPGYSTQIHFKRPESWKWPPQDSREEPVPDGRHHQYYDNHPSSPPPDDNRFRNIEGSQTVSAGILRNQRPLPSPGANERKSVGWSSVINTPPPIPGHSKTFAGSRTRQAPVPSMTELTQRSHEADQIEKFDTMLSGFESGFERNSVYVNSSSSKKGVTSPVCPIPPPPPPTAHQVPAPPRSYVNVNPASGHVDPALDALPVAPPAPRDPIVGRAQSFTNAPSQPTSDRRQRLPVQEDDLYDDTVIEQQQESAERKVQFQQKRQSSVQTPAQCGRNDMRRKTEPTLSISKTEFEEKPIGRLNQSFKNKLEGLFGGSPAPAAQRPVSNKGIRELPATPINRQLSEDHEYQELPEIIPDAVTYVNDKFNVD
ncbi:uncharacterized protein LOC132722900 isoform X20 [Ruditapes philippinarum]|uniref:uncharacterized protein LOC132722900 isoform X20 n=1 Tax=Ruditapes philippinarum TaxID=129788 RepID=UPI00295BD526|nr:uncharacterized protein LOC132722900 isoform X20 [Ruditapes philippinarum]